DPVLNDLIRRILEAGVCAPSGGNMQQWRVLVGWGSENKKKGGGVFKRGRGGGGGPPRRGGGPAPGGRPGRGGGVGEGAAEYLAAHIHEAPVWIVPCLEGGTPTRTSGSSIYPAVQNMLLAARALGLGGCCPKCGWNLRWRDLQLDKDIGSGGGGPPAGFQ